ncbi:MAG: hypothetical protein Unbinned92contig1002_11 [Prokaryotic dsDNA virus sp.]|nr:MAG: hypothetical protein Unbinned92contig1002_11 [Prokaryotic dsDNA virus sp.]|tara:strand:- start:26036 stop:26587 length:552 start_codon:yes stop_codon:yes gene_type:complete
MAVNILIVGNCGVGKTYVVKKLINSLQVAKASNVGLLRYLHNQQYIITGSYVGGMFDGSDKLAMNVMSSLDEFLQKNNNHVIFYEGDRFTNSTFIKKAKPFIIKILGDGKEGREQRNSQQTARHLKSIQTRVNNINAHLELKNSNVCLSVILHCLMHSSSHEELQQQFNKQKEIHTKQQTSLF